MSDHPKTSAQEIRESPSDTVKVGIMLQMLPAHNFVLDAIGDKVKYDETVKRARPYIRGEPSSLDPAAS